MVSGFAYWTCYKENGGDVRFYPDNPDLSDCRNDKELDALRNQVLLQDLETLYVVTLLNSICHSISCQQVYR